MKVRGKPVLLSRWFHFKYFLAHSSRVYYTHELNAVWTWGGGDSASPAVPTLLFFCLGVIETTITNYWLGHNTRVFLSSAFNSCAYCSCVSQLNKLNTAHVVHKKITVFTKINDLLLFEKGTQFDYRWSYAITQNALYRLNNKLASTTILPLSMLILNWNNTILRTTIIY